ncbi:MAG: DUF1697 domain-containing protein [Hyphomicrobiales bacterium]|nr:DUF1697 domain-containing protein [Hyphomicrobiales bacterium]
MTVYVALLRAVNVGGTGKLPMAELRVMCAGIGFADVETYIASGNVIFESDDIAEAVKAALEARLSTHFGKPSRVAMRTAHEMRAVLDANPFPEEARKATAVFFLDEPPEADALEHVKGRNDEEMRPGLREIYVHYPSGMGRSKLKIPATATATARSLNTVAKLVEIAAKR